MFFWLLQASARETSRVWHTTHRHLTASEFQTGAVPRLLVVRKHALFAPQFGMILICNAFAGSNLECEFISTPNCEELWNQHRNTSQLPMKRSAINYDHWQNQKGESCPKPKYTEAHGI